MKPTVAIALFSYRAPCWDTVNSLWFNYKNYGMENVDLIRTPRATEIHRARSQAASAFLKTKNEYLLMVDDDMLIPWGGGAEYARLFKGTGGSTIPDDWGNVCALARIMSHGPDIGIVGGYYVSRTADRHPMVWDANVEPKDARAGNVSGLVKCRWLATGFLRIHRSVLERMIEAGPTKFSEIMPARNAGPSSNYHSFFVNSAHNTGEDASFMARANKLNIQSYVDFDIKLGHIGEYIYGPGQT